MGIFYLFRTLKKNKVIKDKWDLTNKDPILYS